MKKNLSKQVAAAAASNANPLAEATLSKSRAAELDKLLNQTDLYTKFLSEQMDSIEQKTEAEAAAEAAATAASGSGGKKGKKAGKGRPGSAGAAAASATAAAADADKKRKRSADGLSPTQELLPLIEGELRDYQLRGKGGVFLRERVEDIEIGVLVPEIVQNRFSPSFRAFLSHLSPTVLSRYSWANVASF